MVPVITFIAGVFIGGVVGFFCAILAVASGRADERGRRI